MQLSHLTARKPLLGREIKNYGTAAAIEEPINPGVTVNHTQLLINGQFVDSASGVGLLILTHH